VSEAGRGRGRGLDRPAGRQGKLWVGLSEARGGREGKNRAWIMCSWKPCCFNPPAYLSLQAACRPCIPTGSILLLVLPKRAIASMSMNMTQ
jgi:hypothetical protein